MSTNNSNQSMKNEFLLSLAAEKVYVELATRPRSIVQLSRGLNLAPWKICRAVHELKGRTAYFPSRGHWIVTD